MPLISALAARRGFAGQRARSRADESCLVVLTGDVVTAADGSFAGFRGTAEARRRCRGASARRSPGFDHALDELLRSPLDRIIESAERIVERADGPLRSDYASYGNDIASAARHLLSVLRAMSEDPAQATALVDLAALAAEAVIMLESSAEERQRHDRARAPEPLRARGQERAVIQILVNLIVNAIRYSPEDGTVRLNFAQDRRNGLGDRLRSGAGNRRRPTSSASSSGSSGRIRTRAEPVSASPFHAGSRDRWAATSRSTAHPARARASR